ncbi:methyl-accepting chemotaxis protein [Bdellovibrio sp. 22V]|uniref:HAMP domain-containing methyl-accepting chemotaxis protein n=1 Tax=Bdellovibrio TaxID=958 RepID=UPI0025435C99|nr:methyl-accepting chemotaxis protein [Bdellovibrio sp. 22V]WII72073.1 methyl-accepting chemotaxis protein [Bdellovibrio sp. 22V]
MGLTLKKQLWFLCGGFLLVLGGVSVLSYVNSTRLMGQFDNVADVQLPAVRNMTLADMMHDGLRSVVLASLLASESNNAEELAEIKKETAQKSEDFRKYLTNLENLPMNEETKKAIADTKPQMAAYIALTEKIVDISASQGYRVALEELPRFNESFKILEGKMETLGELIEADANTAHESGGMFRTINLVISLVGGLFCLIGGAWLTTTLVSRMSGFAQKIDGTGNSLEETSSHLNKASQDLANGATQSAASLEETVASLEELSSMVKLNSENAKSASMLSQQSFLASKEGAKSLDKLIQSMDALKNSAAKIEEISQVIDDIAFQTNLLALNASVEAARAGEMGKGFAVVADAVRSLAQRSADSAKDISKMIQESVMRIHEGSEAAHQSGDLMNKFLVSAEKVLDINNQIAGASHEQARGITLISEAMNKLDQSSQKNAQVAQEVAQTSDTMSRLSNGMQNLVTELQVLVGRQA